MSYFSSLNLIQSVRCLRNCMLSFMTLTYIIAEIYAFKLSPRHRFHSTLVSFGTSLHLLFTTLQGLYAPFSRYTAGYNAPESRKQLGCSTLHLLSEPTPEVYLWHGISIPYSLAWHSRHSAGDNKNTHNAMQARSGEGRGVPSRNWSPTTPALAAFWFQEGAGKASAILWQHLEPAMSICCGALAK